MACFRVSLRSTFHLYCATVGYYSPSSVDFVNSLKKRFGTETAPAVNPLMSICLGRRREAEGLVGFEGGRIMNRLSGGGPLVVENWKADSLGIPKNKVAHGMKRNLLRESLSITPKRVISF